jgi:hypothetical protein
MGGQSGVEHGDGPTSEGTQGAAEGSCISVFSRMDRVRVKEDPKWQTG